MNLFLTGKNYIVASIPAILVLLMCLSTNIVVVEANGRATLVSSQEKGPYKIDVSIIPGRAVVPNTHVSVLIRSKADDAIVTDANVSIWAVGPIGSTDLGPLLAENRFAPQFYETDLKFDLVGEWQIKVSVDSILGTDSIGLALEVEERKNNINWVMISAIIVAIFALGLFTWDRVSGRNKKKANG